MDRHSQLFEKDASPRGSCNPSSELHKKRAATLKDPRMPLEPEGTLAVRGAARAAGHRSTLNMKICIFATYDRTLAPTRRILSTSVEHTYVIHHDALDIHISLSLCGWQWTHRAGG